MLSPSPHITISDFVEDKQGQDYPDMGGEYGITGWLKTFIKQEKGMIIKMSW